MVTFESILDEISQVDHYAAYTIHYLAKRIEETQEELSQSRYNRAYKASINNGEDIQLNASEC